MASDDEPSSDRRRFLSRLTSVAMGTGLVAGYGAFAGAAVRFLYPTGAGDITWRFLATLGDVEVGDALQYTTPAGAPVVVARQKTDGDASDFIALSSTCPHLGCQVHWEPHNDRFFCPCHNGAFTPEGQPTQGPPAKANTPLLRYDLEVRDGLLYIGLPDDQLTNETKAVQERAGVDRCLGQTPERKA